MDIEINKLIKNVTDEIKNSGIYATEAGYIIALDKTRNFICIRLDLSYIENDDLSLYDGNGNIAIIDMNINGDIIKSIVNINEANDEIEISTYQAKCYIKLINISFDKMKNEGRKLLDVKKFFEKKQQMSEALNQLENCTDHLRMSLQIACRELKLSNYEEALSYAKSLISNNNLNELYKKFVDKMEQKKELSMDEFSFESSTSLAIYEKQILDCLFTICIIATASSAYIDDAEKFCLDLLGEEGGILGEMKYE